MSAPAGHRRRTASGATNSTAATAVSGRCGFAIPLPSQISSSRAAMITIISSTSTRSGVDAGDTRSRSVSSDALRAERADVRARRSHDRGRVPRGECRHKTGDESRHTAASRSSCSSSPASSSAACRKTQHPTTRGLRRTRTHAKQAGHLATGVLLVIAALSLMTFLTHFWTRVTEARDPRAVSPLPIVAAGVAAACIATGGILMGAISGSALVYSQADPQPRGSSARQRCRLRDGRRRGDARGRPEDRCLSAQARAAGIFGVRLARFSLTVAVVLLASVGS